PGKTPGNTYAPASLVGVVRSALVAVLVNVTFAPGTTASTLSRTVPRTVVLLACGQAVGRKNSAPKIQIQIRCIRSLLRKCIIPKTTEISWVKCTSWTWPMQPPWSESWKESASQHANLHDLIGKLPAGAIASAVPQVQSRINR